MTAPSPPVIIFFTSLKVLYEKSWYVKHLIKYSYSRAVKDSHLQYQQSNEITRSTLM